MRINLKFYDVFSSFLWFGRFCFQSWCSIFWDGQTPQNISHASRLLKIILRLCIKHLDFDIKGHAVVLLAAILHFKVAAFLLYKWLLKPQLEQSMMLMSDTEFFFILPRAKINNLPASTKFWQLSPIFSLIFYVLKA